MRGALRLLAGPASSDRERLDQHRARLGPYSTSRRSLIDVVRAAGLTGRGGGGFPTAAKLAAVRASSRRKGAVVVANGVESAPASAKDQSLLVRRPHLVLDGLQLAGRLVGADRLLLALPHRGAAPAVVREALLERRAQLPDEMEVELLVSPGGFVAGEETALTAWVDGGVSKPRPVPPRPFEQGVAGRPTLVQNVETLANLALIARFGSKWFRSVGLESETGSTLVSVSGAISQPGVYEIAVGTPFPSLLEAAGWDESAQAILVGGYFGTWISAQSALEIRFCRADLAALGAAPGAGVLAVLAPERCGLQEGAWVLRWLAGESSGQCGPCVMGLSAIAGALERVADPTTYSVELPPRILRWCDDVQGRGACHHPDGAVRFARSVLLTFAAELAVHAKGHCLAPGSASAPVTPRREAVL